ncbi:ABC transporter permease [Candidatus Zixiibacteriota bacterium]
MIVGSIFKIAFDALKANRLRSSLTLLGVMIGVTSVMTIISALEGMMDSIEQDLARLGPSTFVVSRMGMITSEEMFREKIKRKKIDISSVEYIEEGCVLCEKVAPRIYTFQNLKNKNETLRNVFVVASTYNYIDIVDMEVQQGRFHSSEDDVYSRQVVYIGDLIRETFFSGVDPIGKTVKIGPKKYTVIGVGKKYGSTFGQSQDNYVVIPMSSFIKQFGKPNRRLEIFVKAYNVDVLDDAMDQTRMALRAQRHVPFNKGDDFDLLTADNILEVLNSITKIFRMGLVGISSISLVVGGIVVMNIMMVSVSERTREIGIRKSIGAKRKHILIQFVFESLLLTLTGGIVGVVLGFFIAKSLVGMLDMEISPSTLAIIAGLSISTGIGLIFGIYPAMKAARLDPIKALSYE